MNTGHDGGACTVHANSVREIPARMRALAGLGGMAPAALDGQLAAAVQVVLQMRRHPVAGRVLDEIGVLRRDHGDREPRVEPAWTREGGPGSGHPLLTTLLAERGVRAPC